MTPVERPQATPAAEAAGRHAPRPTVLVVDDAPSQRLLARLLVESSGYPVLEAADGREALEVLAREPVSIVVSDWMMEGMNGLELCQAVRSRDLGRYIYVILATARNERADLLAGMNAGADDFLVKPLDRALLAVRLRVAERIVGLEQELRAGAARLEQAYAIIRDDLNAAATLQRELLPAPDVRYGRVRIGSLLTPSQIVSGDSFNHFRLATGEIALYALDVSGHGTRAALLSVMLARMLTPERFMEGGAAKVPSRIVAELNRHFQDSGDEVREYFTILCARLSVDGRRLTYCQAGHPSPLLARRSGTIERLGDGGFPVGMLPDIEYVDEEAALEPGDRLMIASDGLFECMAPSGEQFGHERLEELLAASRGAALPDLLSSLTRSLGRWRARDEPEDDVSVLVIDIHEGDDDRADRPA
jgi:sigma-B regulation protein RsbU (phosphoserine phosphatase)